METVFYSGRVGSRTAVDKARVLRRLRDTILHSRQLWWKPRQIPQHRKAAPENGNMTDLILNQQVKRRQAAHRPVARGTGLLKVAESINRTDGEFQGVAGRLTGMFRRLDPFVLYVTAATTVVVLVLVVTAAVHGIGLPPQTELQSLPRDTVIDYLVTDYITPGQDEGTDNLPGVPARQLPTAIDPISHTLQRGDTVSDIARRYGVKLDTIISYNGIQDVKRIYAGDDILIPAVNGNAMDGVKYVVKRGDSLQGISEAFGVDLEPILDINSIESTIIQPGLELFIPHAVMDDFNRRKALGTLFLKPYNGHLIKTSGFGMRLDPFTNTNRFHYGVDWAAPIGTPVLASNHGTVVYRNQNSTLGKYVLIKHDRGYQTLYAHLSAWTVRVGEYVQQGQKIGETGNTGRSTGPHLHFVIYINGKPVDPERIL